MCSNFKTVIEHFDTGVILYKTNKILPISNQHRLVINKKDYEIAYLDWNLDEEIFYVIVHDNF